MSRMEAMIDFKKRIEAATYVVQTLIRFDELAPGELDKIKEIFPKWELYIGKTISMATKVLYQGDIYNTLSEHEVLAHLNPVDANYLFGKITTPGVIEEWEQRDYTNAYQIGDRVMWQGKVYELILGGNAYAYSPTDYPQGWKVVD